MSIILIDDFVLKASCCQTWMWAVIAFGYDTSPLVGAQHRGSYILHYLF